MTSYEEARQAIADSQLALAALRSHLLFKRLMALALELHYRPDQPRAPAGTRIGGQWIDDPSVPGSAGEESRPVRVSSSDDDIRIDLELEDQKGGTAIAIMSAAPEPNSAPSWRTR